MCNVSDTGWFLLPSFSQWTVSTEKSGFEVVPQHVTDTREAMLSYISDANGGATVRFLDGERPMAEVDFRCLLLSYCVEIPSVTMGSGMIWEPRDVYWFPDARTAEMARALYDRICEMRRKKTQERSLVNKRERLQELKEDLAELEAEIAEIESGLANDH